MSQLEREVRLLLAQGQKIEAIKKVRHLTGQGLKEAKDYVDSLEKSRPSTDPTTAPSQVRLEAEVRDLVAQGRRVEAIKRAMDIRRRGLKDAKDFVDSLAKPVASYISRGGISRNTLKEVRSLATQGRKIEAIKRLREATGMSLREAKDFVDAL